MNKIIFKPNFKINALVIIIAIIALIIIIVMAIMF
ncbi:hypothetical protein L950_0230290 [Sphingobacterium sp. IITKGP-BTPF85]|nr:hypothetical protein L950_0230290 [Sphingobacterium sp. IITKGP-BTPF85]